MINTITISSDYIEQEIKPKLHVSHQQTYNRGSSGDVGNSIEQLFGVNENNRNTSDTKEFEIKTKDNKHDNIELATFFNLEPTFKHDQPQFIQDHGNVGRDDELYRFNHIVRHGLTNISGKGFYIDHNPSKLLVKNSDKPEKTWAEAIPGMQSHEKYSDYVVCDWDISKILTTVENKLHNCILFFWHDLGNNEYMIDSCTIFQEVISSIFINEIIKGNIIIDFKLKLEEDGSIRNRGTAFRAINESVIKNIYKGYRIIC